MAITPEVVDLLDRIDELVADGRREQAVETFFREAVRAPDHEIELLKAKDAWSVRVANAHTMAREASRRYSGTASTRHASPR